MVEEDRGGEPKGFHELTLASILYEIGRFRKRATDNLRPYLEVGREWLEGMNLPGVLQSAEKHRKLIAEAAALAAGGNLPEEPEGDGALRPLVSVFSRASLPRRGKEQVPSPGKARFYALRELGYGSDACPYPQESVSVTQHDYRRLWEGFERDLRAFGGLPPISYALLLLERYASFVPHVPSDPEGPRCDLSLFDQARTTAAIASCLYQRITEEEEEDFSWVDDRFEPHYLLVGGDFSGTQKFIYRISSKGALKTLRARSFFLELFTEHVIWELLEPLGLSRANVFYAGGARFTLLLPNTDRARQGVQKVRRAVNHYFAEHHGARIYLVLEMEELCGEDLAIPLSPELDRKDFWTALGRRISRRKQRKFSEYLEEGEAESFASLLLPQELDRGEPRVFPLGKEECPWCHRPEADLQRIECKGEPAFGCHHCLKDRKVGECKVCHRIAWLIPLPHPEEEEEVRTCFFCRALYHLGEHLHALRYILRTKAVPPEPQRVFLQVGETGYLFPLVPKGIRSEEFSPGHFSSFQQQVFEDPGSMAWLINEERPDSFREKAKLHPFLLANYHFPNDRESVQRGFQGLAEKALGARRIGALRMDVDSLGNLLGSGLLGEGGLLRYTALSRLLNRFFKLYLNGFCAGKSLPNGQARLISLIPGDPAPRQAAVVYAGGDDLFLVGAWSDIALLAFDIHGAFTAYAGNNPDVTLSAGMIVQDPKFPLYQMAELAGEAEKKAKDNLDETSSRDDPDEANRKDSLAPFFPSWIFAKGRKEPTYALKWKEALGLISIAQELVLGMGGRVEGGALTTDVPRAFLHALFDVVESRRRTGRLYLPKLAYALTQKASQDQKEGQEWLDQLKQRLWLEETLAYLHPALVWVELLARREGEQE